MKFGVYFFPTEGDWAEFQIGYTFCTSSNTSKARFSYKEATSNKIPILIDNFILSFRKKVSRGGIFKIAKSGPAHFPDKI